VGCKKDNSSWYIDILPEEWKRELSNPRHAMNGIDIRHMYFEGNEQFSVDLPWGVTMFLQSWKSSALYAKLADEHNFIKEYKKTASVYPWPITYVTTDVVVEKNVHVLLVRRKFNPGKGLLALPGGFISQTETIIESAFRELKEETRILVPKEELMKYVVDQHVFDHPQRSERGRTITHAFCVKLPNGGPLPHIKGSDDAERAIWMPLTDLFIKESEFYEDHCHIIEFFTRKL
jgi:bifunctional NMN adenylyltransferase/nudix hydrolase